MSTTPEHVAWMLSYAEEHGKWGFNCGSFALGVPDVWYIPRMWENKHEYDEAEDFLYACAEDIAEEFGLRILRRWKQCKPDTKIIAFRIEAGKWHYRDDADFHFRIRIDGQWWEKMGGHDIVPVNEDITDDWDCGYLYYDSDIVFMTEG